MFTSLIGLGILLSTVSVKAVNYSGNGDTGFGGPVGGGTLSVTDNGSQITFTLAKGPNSLNNVLVLYIDNGTGGFADTSGFTDSGDGARKAISGFDGGANRSVMTFTNGFRPQSAITIEGGYSSLFYLANGGSFPYGSGIGQGGDTNATFSLTINSSQIGLAANVNTNIKIFGTYISGGGYRSTEAIAGNDTTLFSQGWNPFTQTAYVTYSFAAPAPVPHPVSFSVDMAQQTANAAFSPLTDTVYAKGSFENTPGTGFLLVQSNSSSIYTNTYADLNPTNTVETYNYWINNTAKEVLNTRPFTLVGGGQILPVAYFGDVAPSSGVPTHGLTFKIKMTPQIDLGNFVPGTDTIEVRGTFQNPTQFAGGFELIASDVPGVYTNTYPDANYPGTYEYYKYVIVHPGPTAVFESTSDRVFFTPAGNTNFPTQYFNNISSAYNIPVTFQVDMTVPILTGQFNPNVDTCGAAGLFQTNQWTVGANGFVLVASSNPNIYTNTYIVKYAPGTGEEYKFVINHTSSTDYESIPNRTFIVPSGSTNLPVVFWNNFSSSDVLLTDTPVTFSVNMTNAVGTDSHVFDPTQDNVYINGQFIPWYEWFPAANPADRAAYKMFEQGLTTIYTNTFLIKAGTPVAFYYKYGIGINAATEPTDDEAPSGNDHYRVVRSTAFSPYTMATDTFGYQYQEPLFSVNNPAGGRLAVGSKSGGTVPVTWLGRPGARLQVSTNLTAGNWQTIAATDGTNWTSGFSSTNGFVSRTNWPATSTSFFRLLKQ